MDGHEGEDNSTGHDGTYPMGLLAMAAAQAAATFHTPQLMQPDGDSLSRGEDMDITPAEGSLPSSMPAPSPLDQSTRGKRGRGGSGRPRASRGKRGANQGAGRGAKSKVTEEATLATAPTENSSTSMDVTDSMLDSAPFLERVSASSAKSAQEVAQPLSITPRHTTEPLGRKTASRNAGSTTIQALDSDDMDLDPLPSDQTLDRRPQPLATKPVYKKRTKVPAVHEVSESAPGLSTSATSAASDGLIRRGGVGSWRDRRMEPRQEYQRPRPMNAYDVNALQLEQKLMNEMQRKRAKRGSSAFAEGSKQAKTVGESLARHEASMLDKIEKLYTRPLPHRDIVKMLQMELDAEEQILQQMEERLQLEMTRLKVEEEVLLEILEMSADANLDASMFSPKESSASERAQRPSASDTTVPAATTTQAPLGVLLEVPDDGIEPPADGICLPPLSHLPQHWEAPPELPEPTEPTAPRKRLPLSPPKPPGRERPSGTHVPQELSTPTPFVSTNLHGQAPLLPSLGATVTSKPLPTSISASAPMSTTTPTTSTRTASRQAPTTSASRARTKPPAPAPISLSHIPPLAGGTDTSDNSFMAALSILEQHEQAEERQRDQDEDEEDETEEDTSSSEESMDEDEADSDFEDEDEEAARSALRSMLAQIGDTPFGSI
ncbi:hypothetical protein BGZ73_000966 [Actinomortierella ambigua]|nr:hypothetical protein BGZ73_000966 [Actinomortierella ambigua]